jgi:phage baseplate assembly protein W
MALGTTISRIGTPENLPNGSTHDLLLVNVSDGYPVGEVTFKFEDTPRKITGIQKVAQFFMKVLFTQKGSDIINFNLGTNFPELALGANRTSADANFLADVTETVKDAESQTRGLLASLNKDLDSQLNSIVVQSISTEGESLIMYLQVVTRAGETASIAVPFPELDMKLANA